MITFFFSLLLLFFFFFFFCCFFLILRAQCFVSVKGNMLQGDMVKKNHPAVAHFAEELHVDSHGSAQIRHRATTYNSAAFSFPV